MPQDTVERQHMTDSDAADERKPRWLSRGGALAAAVVVILIASIGIYAAASRRHPSASISPTAPATSAQTPAAPSTPTVAYKADWSHGADGWTLTPHWHIVNAHLVNDGTGDGNTAVPVPYSIMTPDYAVEMSVAVEGISGQQSCGNYFALEGRASDGTQLFSAGMQCIPSPDHAPVQTSGRGQSSLTVHGSNGARVADNFQGRSPHRYRVEVHGKSAKYFPGNVSIGGLTGDVALSPAQLFITDADVQITVYSLTIYTL
jgi:hypothetical protein